MLKVFLARDDSCTPGTPAAVQPFLLPTQISSSTPFVLIVLHGVSNADLLFHLGLKLTANAHDLLCHIATASVLMAGRFCSICCELFGAAFVLAIYILRGEAVSASAAFDSFVTFTEACTNAAAF